MTAFDTYLGDPMARLRRIGVLAVVAIVCAAWAASAHADLTFNSFTAGGFNADGSPATQAGGHPFALTTTFDFATVTSDAGTTVADGSPKDITVALPAGVIGDPTKLPRCSQVDMDRLAFCPTDTQVGIALVDVAFFGGRTTHQVPVYNLDPPAGMPAQFGFKVIAANVHIDIGVRTDGDYGVTARLHNLNAAAPVYSSTLTLWGVPASSAHDAERYLPGVDTPGDASGNPLASQAEPAAFLRNPTACGGPLTTTIRATTWQQPNNVVSASATAPAITGCSAMPFAPTASFKPDTSQAGQSAGFGINIHVPQNNATNGVSSADVHRVAMAMPAGVAINPSAADGLQGCQDADFAITTPSEDNCPNGSKIGTVTITTPLLNDPLTGSIFLGQPLEQGPVAAAAGRMFRLFLEAQGSGVTVKLAGSIVPDPVTGQLTATFNGNPQLPFSDLDLDIVGGSRSALATPKACGTYTTHALITPWGSGDAAPVDAPSSFTINQGCDQAGKFEPTLNAGLTNPVAGSSSSFALNVSRPNGQQDITGVTVSLPPGLLANVGSVPLCDEADAAAGTCSAASLIGHTTVASGVGSNPVYIPQAGKAPTGVYLSGPYNGAPYSLSIVVPAQAGPFDLGVVTVRAALFVDPVDAHVTVQSDPIPTILLGVPLNIQKLNVTVDRPGFMVSPTNCSAMRVAGKVSSATTAVDVGNAFQVSNCAALKVAPVHKFALSGAGQTTDGKHPALTANVSIPAGGANLKTEKVTLPLALALDPDNSQSDDLCEFAVGKQTIPQCPAASIVGTATAVTPLLNVPLTGPVYFVKNVRIDPKSGRQIRTLPTLAIPLRGGGITLVLRGASSVVDNHLVTTFASLPDAPVTSFKLSLNGGKKAILVVSGADVCKSSQVVQDVTTGQNGRVHKESITMGTPCALGVVGSSHTSSTLKLTVSGLGAGKVSVSGSGIVKSTRTITSATTATLQAKFTKTVASRLAHGHDVTVRVTVSFTPKGAKHAKTSHKTITIHG